MATKKPKQGAARSTDRDVGCCKIESLISMDQRGQMVLPKDLRDKAGIRPGDKLAAITWERQGRVCCITLIKADDFAEMVQGVLGPLAEGGPLGRK